MPPEDPHDYHSETAGTVFRYRDGEITVADGYRWSRDDRVDVITGLRAPGAIVRVDAEGQEVPMHEYSKYSVFHCWGPLPCVYEKADALSTPIGEYEGGGYRWNLMSFVDKSLSPPGLTRIAAGGQALVVAGRSPSWMPRLVPELFWNGLPNLPRSTGLGGELPVIIAQMALSQPPGETDVPFRLRWWRHGRWSPVIVNNTGEIT
ncbi:hypothetical protein F4777DRAFT_285496 [Nemania sp. FL0916]|nr:hypothetical protein F4777DRAFT_285496 [Nemania sp. FL0916]